MSSNSENEDLDNVPLVRMEDVQPSRERVVDSQSLSKDDELYETYIEDDIECANEYVVDDDDDSNIGSMVSLQSEDVYEDDSSSQELIIPEVLEENDEPEAYLQKEESSEVYLECDLETCSDDDTTEEACVVMEHDDVEEQIDAHIEAARMLKENQRQNLESKSLQTKHQGPINLEHSPSKLKAGEEIIIKPPSETWPTLEILPGGVIKNREKCDDESCSYPDKLRETVANTGDMMYACAKCSQTFKYLFCLVKHVKWHEDQKKVTKDPETGRLKGSPKQYICLHSGSKKILAAELNKRKAPKRLKTK